MGFYTIYSRMVYCGSHKHYGIQREQTRGHCHEVCAVRIVWLLLYSNCIIRLMKVRLPCLHAGHPTSVRDN